MPHRRPRAPLEPHLRRRPALIERDRLKAHGSGAQAEAERQARQSGQQKDRPEQGRHGSRLDRRFLVARGDPHATQLHRSDLDHERLTYRFGGGDHQLTDVAGEVVKGILA